MALPFFAVTLFVSAFLLFLVQPMVGKMILPRLGGTPNVWNTCMVFFQMALLAGYAYTHTISTRLRVRTQLLVHCVILFVPVLLLIAGSMSYSNREPTEFNVVVKDAGSDVRKLAEKVASVSILTVDQAEKKLKQLPLVVVDNVDRGEAERVKAILAGVGATVEIEPVRRLEAWFYAGRRELDPVSGGNPIFQTLAWLLIYVGLPFFVVATTAPLLQRWFGFTGHPSGEDPYFLYAASNLGSFGSLLAYPFFLEWVLTLNMQAWMWIVGYIVLAVMVVGCALLVYKSPHLPEKVEEPTPEEIAASAQKSGEGGEEETGIKAGTPPAEKPTAIRKGKGRRGKRGKKLGDKAKEPVVEPKSAALSSIQLPPTDRLGPVTPMRRLRWVALTFVPSSLMLGATTYITTDLSPIPLLWLIPLMLYLLSFVLVFSKWPTEWVGQPHKVMVIAMPFAVVPLVLTMAGPSLNILEGYTFPMMLHIVAFWLTTMVCHGELARDRPRAEHLTEFYLWMSVGGMLGGMFNALVAPVFFFVGPMEYGIAIILGCLLRPRLTEAGFIDRLLSGTMSEGGSRRESVSSAADLAKLMDYAVPVVVLIYVAAITFGLSRAMTNAFVLDLIAYGLPGILILFLLGRPIRFGLSVGAVLLVTGLYGMYGPGGDVVYRARSFFGIIKVKRQTAGTPVAYTTLIHGRINHGMCFAKPDDPADWGNPLEDFSRLATTYYHRWGPAGVVMAQYDWFHDFDKVNVYRDDARMPASLVGFGFQSLSLSPVPNGVLVDMWSEPPYATIGLGTGTMASYGRLFQHVHYYEIDSNIVRLSTPPRGSGDPRGPEDKYLTPELYRDYIQGRYGAKTYFTYLADAKARGAEVWVFMGDARLRMARDYLETDDYLNRPEVRRQWNNAYSVRVIDTEDCGGPDGFYHMMVVDAFSSDAIPVHLLTKEAMRMYMRKLTEKGILCVHTSNRYVNLVPVVADVAASLGYASRRGHDQAPMGERGLEKDASNLAEYLDEEGHFTSEWVMVARKAEYLNDVLKAPDNYTTLLDRARDNPRHRSRRGSPPNPSEPYWTTPPVYGRHVWTDDFSPLILVFREYMRWTGQASLYE